MTQQTGKTETLFDVAADGSNIAIKHVAPEADQEEHESRRLWSKLTDAIGRRDMEAATESKAAVEDAQREDARRREETGEKYIPRFFEQGRDGLWIAKIK